ncbi:MAG: polyprenyl synthetase family protein [Actinobacteria bacterium]|nr:polyprenyl synthetase family protein [Actinomycetota bacterium]
MRAAEALELAPLADDLARVEARLQESVRHPDRFLGEVASHLVTAGGKRIRPTLTLCAAYASSTGTRPTSDEAVTGAVACELVHLGSLYHDDVIDEAETRRGVPSVNARWSNIVAILSGDYLLARASSLAASLGADVAALLADTIGELCRGQVNELQHLYDVARSEEDYQSTIEGKTASLFATACRIGGMVSGVDEPTLDALTRYGHHLGMCFQIVDDCLDLTATDEVLGKPSGQDLAEGIYTLPVIYAIDTCEPLRSMLGAPMDPARLAEARALATSDGAVPSALDVAHDHATKAREALAGAEHLDPQVTAGLDRLVEGLVSRDS